MSALKNMVNDLNDVIEQTYHLEQQIYKWTQTVNANKEKISKAMGRKNRLDVRVDEQTMFSVNKRVDTNIKFFEDQLARKLDKKKFKQVTNKKLEVENIRGLISFLKSYGVDPNEFKNYIKTSHEVDIDEIERLIEIGEIQIEDLHGCYSAEFNEEIKVRRSK